MTVQVLYMLHNTIEFFLNEFPWIQWIQWIVTKSKRGMATTGITQLAPNTLPVLVSWGTFSLLYLDGYLLSITSLNRYQPRDSSGKFFFATTSSNISIVSYRMSLVPTLFLDLIMVHWIHWIPTKIFRKNSNRKHAICWQWVELNTAICVLTFWSH